MKESTHESTVFPEEGLSKIDEAKPCFQTPAS